MVRQLALTILLITQSISAYGATKTTITNNIMGVGPNGRVKPYICIQDKNGVVTYTLASGESINATTYSGNEYYAGATVRFGGCNAENTYLGYIGISFGSSMSLTYKAPEGIHITYANPAINPNGQITGEIRYTAIQPNFELFPSQPSQYADLPFVGINLSGLKFGKVIDPVVVPNLS